MLPHQKKAHTPAAQQKRAPVPADQQKKAHIPNQQKKDPIPTDARPKLSTAKNAADQSQGKKPPPPKAAARMTNQQKKYPTPLLSHSHQPPEQQQPKIPPPKQKSALPTQQQKSLAERRRREAKNETPITLTEIDMSAKEINASKSLLMCFLSGDPPDAPARRKRGWDDDEVSPGYVDNYQHDRRNHNKAYHYSVKPRTTRTKSGGESEKSNGGGNVAVLSEATRHGSTPANEMPPAGGHVGHEQSESAERDKVHTRTDNTH